MDQKKVLNYLLKIKPEAVILAAYAKVGGIEANTMRQRADRTFDNLTHSK